MKGDYPGIFDFRKERRIRESLGLTRADVVNEIGEWWLDIDTICAWEKGVYAPSLDTANLIAVLYDCYLDDFLKDGYFLQ